MIWLDDNGKIVIRTNLEKNEMNEIVEMKRSVLNLLASQDEHFANRDENYWAFQLVQLLEPEPEQICLQK
jgi:hypothetical protein